MMRTTLPLMLLSILSCHVIRGFGAAVFPIGVGAMGITSAPHTPASFRGGMGLYRGAPPPALHGALMQSPHGFPPYVNLAYPGMGGGHPLDRCNGGNCGYWGGCHDGHCGEFYDFRPCHTPECFDGPIHGSDCMDGSCKRVCNGANCKDFVIRGCSGKGSPVADHSAVNVSNGDADD